MIEGRRDDKSDDIAIDSWSLTRPNKEDPGFINIFFTTIPKPQISRAVVIREKRRTIEHMKSRTVKWVV